VLVPSIDRAVLNGQRNDAATAMRRFAEALRAYHHDTRQWPGTGTEGHDGADIEVASAFTCLRENAWRLQGWSGPYASITDSTLRDPWGQPYVVYRFATEYCHSGGGICIVSGGPDGSVTSPRAAILAGTALDDDLVEIVAARL
jgi:hypothetical protein